MLLFSCSSGGGGGNGGNTGGAGPGARTTTGINGGTITSSDNKVTLALVPRAVLTDTTITITPLSSFPADARVIPGTVHEFGPDGTLFNNRVELTITYDPLNLPAGVNEDDLVIGKVINGAWQPVFGSLVDAVNNTVSVPIRGFSTYAVLNGKRVNNIFAYVVDTPAAANQFSDLGSAADHICQNIQAGQKGAIIIRKTPVSIGILNIACDIEFTTDNNTPPTFDGSVGGSTINTSAPASFVGFQFSGTTTFNTGDDLSLTRNTFDDLNVNPGTVTAPFGAGTVQTSVSRAAAGCFDGNTLIKKDTVAGTLTMAGDAKVCGDTALQRGDITNFVVGGNIEFALTAKLEMNGSLVKSIFAEARFSGNAETTVASIQGNDISTFKLHLVDGDIKFNQLNHDISGTLTVDTDGVADLTVNQKGLAIGGNYDLKTSGMGLDTKTYYNATLDVKGDATLGVGGSLEGKVLGTTFWGKVTSTMGLNARTLSLDQVGVTFKGQVRHDLLTDQAAGRTLTAILNGNASTTYEKGVGSCVSTGASARVEYTDSFVKKLGLDSIGAALFVVGKTSCNGQLFKPSLVATRKTAQKQAVARAAGTADEIIIRNIINPAKDQLFGIDIKNVDLPVTIEHNQLTAVLLGLRIKNVSKRVVINDNTIDAIGGVELADLPDALFSNNHMYDNTGLVINADALYGVVLSRVEVTGNIFGPEGVILAGPYGTSIVTATGNTLYGAANASYMGLSGNTFTGGSVGDANLGGGFFIDPGKGANSGLDDENDISSPVDWTGNGCADYPPRDDVMTPDGCIGGGGVPPPVLPLGP